ncbi:hypothetical protein ACHAXT_004157 [Thalassiosira profunda]
MRWPTPCFLLLRGQNNHRGRVLPRREAHRTPRIGAGEPPVVDPRFLEGVVLGRSPAVEPPGPPPPTLLRVGKMDGQGARDASSVPAAGDQGQSRINEAGAMPDNVEMLDGTRANGDAADRAQSMDISVASGSMKYGEMKLSEGDPAPPPMETVAEEGSLERQASMDISEGGLQNTANGEGAATNIDARASLESVEEYVGEEAETMAAAVDLMKTIRANSAQPLLHHNSSLSNRTRSASEDAVADGEDMIDEDCLVKGKLKACKSIEEASVNTTIQSVTVEEAEKIMVEAEKHLDAPRSTIDSADVAELQPAPSGGSDDSPQTPADHHSVNLRLTPEEDTLFLELTHAAEAYEAGQLIVDPTPPRESLSARGGFTKQESKDNQSWKKLPPDVERIEIRVAGGWVRDKLLNNHSADVDVALDCMMGVQFARIVQSYLAQKMEEEERLERESMTTEEKGLEELMERGKRNAKHPEKKKRKKQPRIGVIGANPSQSKHLETATMKVHGMDVDFVNLRAEEVYEPGSRIPTSDTRMFGTPLEDALRRDFTINSLFYNVRSRKIEDWTGRGLDDLLVHRKIVTPIDPHVTFHDDPLRVLRAVRFCVRLDFTLDDQIKEAAMSKRVHHSLHVKVSRERIGKEVEGMLTGKHARPGRALDMIASLHLAGSVFAFPGSFPGDHEYAGGPVTGHILGVDYSCSLGLDGPLAVELAAGHRARGWEESSSLLDLLPKVMEGHAAERESVLRERSDWGERDGGENDAFLLPSEADSRLLHLCSFILPFHSLTFPDKKGREVTVTSHMIKEALKFPVRDVQAVSRILSHVDEMTAILSEIRSQLAAHRQGAGGEEAGQPFRLTPLCRLRAGLLLRSLKENWVTCLLAAAAWEIRSFQRPTVEDYDPALSMVPAEQPSRELYRALVHDLDLDQCWKVRPHLNGKEMIKELSLPKGPVVGVYLEDQTRWMLLNPRGTKEECMAHLRERKREREQEGAEGESNVGIAGGDGHSSPIAQGENGKHFSKKIRADPTGDKK